MLPQWSRGAPGTPLSERKISSGVEKEIEELGTSYSSSYLLPRRIYSFSIHERSDRVLTYDTSVLLILILSFTL